MNITLRIKRKYFDLILSGRKRVEYRDCKAFYDRLFETKRDATTLTLHYQQKRKLICDIVEIKKISVSTARRLTPEEFTEEDDDIEFGSHLYAIYLKRPRLI